MVWSCVERVYPGRLFLDYAVLGDDVLIADKAVATLYRQWLDKLGVSISIPKSLISTTGCVEFAKRFLVNALSVDLSPISARCLGNYYHPNGLSAIQMKYSVQRCSTFCRIGGLGYKALGRITTHRSLSTERRWVSWLRHHLPLELWLGHGRPLNPYLKGALVRFCLSK